MVEKIDMRSFFYLVFLCLPILILSCQSDQKEERKSSAVSEEKTVTVNLRKKVKPESEASSWEEVEFTETWDPQKTAIIVTDMWDRHWCERATQRVSQLAPVMNKTLENARAMGVTIIHAPSGTMNFYKDSPQRKAAIKTPTHNAPKDFPINDWCYLDENKEVALPIDDSDGGCDMPCSDGKPCEEMTAWSRQIESIGIEEKDYITDQGQEVYNILVENKIDNIVVMGVHLNMCVLGRPFAIRQLANLKKNVVLMRDMTDTMYNPEMPPYVSHFEGTDLVIDHVEKFWAPTLVSSDFTDEPAFVFNEN